MPVTLRLTRKGFGIELRRGPFEIWVDDSAVGSIDHGATVEIQVAPGRHTLRIRKGRYRSTARSFTADDGDAVGFRCYGASLWPVWLASYAVPGVAISLAYE
jgi:hypothetical protein